MMKMKFEIHQIAKQIEAQGGKLFLVGGAIRDQIRGVKPKDLDFMISGIEQELAMRIVARFGEIVEDEAVKGLPVFIAKIDGESFEFAMARKEVDVAPGKHGFEFIASPEISPLEDMRRRDFTIGAMRQDVLSGRIFDPFDGRGDIERGILRHVAADTFVESPERVLRGAAQAARFGFFVHEETIALMRLMKVDFDTIAKEQIWMHIEKAAAGATEPIFWLDVMQGSKWIEFFPEVNVSKASLALLFSPKGSVPHFVAALLTGMSHLEEQSFLKRIHCPKSVRREALDIKHFGVDGRPKQLVHGRDLDWIEPGPKMGEAVRWAWIMQINKPDATKEDIVAWLKGQF